MEEFFIEGESLVKLPNLPPRFAAYNEFHERLEAARIDVETRVEEVEPYDGPITYCAGCGDAYAEDALDAGADCVFCLERSGIHPED